MMENIMKDFVEVLKNNPNHAYDFIANNYWKMSKEELKDITKELLYGVEEYVLKKEWKEITQNVADELEDIYEDEEA